MSCVVCKRFCVLCMVQYSSPHPIVFHWMLSASLCPHKQVANSLQLKKAKTCERFIQMHEHTIHHFKQIKYCTHLSFSTKRKQYKNRNTAIQKPLQYINTNLQFKQYGKQLTNTVKDTNSCLKEHQIQYERNNQNTTKLKYITHKS
eukprot:m.99264 g.99264  ORF g.99264 m.99264 type:complete len:146 (+) comp12530_c0_seq20:4107-4544(+)